jgi:hypothetical protein
MKHISAWRRIVNIAPRNLTTPALTIVWELISSYNKETDMPGFQHTCDTRQRAACRLGARARSYAATARRRSSDPRRAGGIWQHRRGNRRSAYPLFEGPGSRKTQDISVDQKHFKTISFNETFRYEVIGGWGSVASRTKSVGVEPDALSARARQLYSITDEPISARSFTRAAAGCT